jgi:hypothetical protein
VTERNVSGLIWVYTCRVAIHNRNPDRSWLRLSGARWRGGRRKWETCMRSKMLIVGEKTEADGSGWLNWSAALW